MDIINPSLIAQQGLPGVSRSPTYEGKTSGSPFSEYGGGVVSVRSDNQSGVNTVSNDAPGWVKRLTVFVVPSLLAAIVALLIYIATGFRTDFATLSTKFETFATNVSTKFDTLTTKLDTKFDNLTTEMNKNHVELVRDISTIAGKLEPRPKDK